MAGILTQDILRIPGRIKSDEDGNNPLARFAQALHRLRHFIDRCRAYIGAETITEINEQELTAQIFVRHLVAILVNEGEGGA